MPPSEPTLGAELSVKSLIVRIVVAATLVCAAAPAAYSAVVTGTVTDSTSGEPIGYATIAVPSEGISASANGEGRYRLVLPEGEHTLVFSHVAHYSLTRAVTIDSSSLDLSVRLIPAVIDVGSYTVYDAAYDAAQKIIIEAIQRKDAILRQVDAYEAEAYTRLVVRNLDDPVDEQVLLIAETQLLSSWAYPNDYKEIITSRRQTSNLPPEANLVTVGQVLNFNKNRVDLGRYAIVSPTASDALEHYNYYLLDTIVDQGKNVFVLEIEPRSNAVPLFTGTIHILDSVYSISGVDVGLNDAFEVPYIDSFHYSLTYAPALDTLWMPSLIRFDGRLDLDFPGLRNLQIDYLASLHSYNLRPAFEKGMFSEVVLEVADSVDEYDSTRWTEGMRVPLNDFEQYAYKRIDSLENLPPKWYEYPLFALGFAFGTLLDGYDLFHFNRAEGAYLGYGFDFENALRGLDVRIAGGYAFDAKYWQDQYRLSYLLNERYRWKVYGEYHDKTRARPTIIAKENGNATILSLTSKIDPYDYFREEAAAFGTSFRPLRYVTLGVDYLDANQHSMKNSSDYVLFSDREEHRLNPAIAVGRMRSVTGSITFDNRIEIKDRGRFRKIGQLRRTMITLSVEAADPAVVDNDFDFTRYSLSVDDVRPVFGVWLNRLYFYAGTSAGLLPPQRYFGVDYGSFLLEGREAFLTMDEENFAGDRVVAVYDYLDVGRTLFRATGLKLFDKIPFTLNVHGGAFWTEFGHTDPPEYYRDLPNTRGPYTEAGFGLGGILPFTLMIDFTWQVSDYPTNEFTAGFTGGF